MGTVLRAHDPGLSSLDVRVSGGAISVSLSMAAPDVALLAAGGEADAAAATERACARCGSPFCRWRRASVSGRRSRDRRRRCARAVVVRRWTQTRRQARRLAITSDVPARMARGHRELMVVSVDDRVVAERLLDAESGPAAIDLEAASPSRGSRRLALPGAGRPSHPVGVRPSGVSGGPAPGGAHRARAGGRAHGVHRRPLRVAGAGCDRRGSRTGVDRRAAHRRLDRVGRPGKPAARAARRPLARGLRVRADPRVRLRRGARRAGARVFASRDRAGAASRSTPASRPASLRRRPPCCRSSGRFRSRPAWQARLVPVCSVLIVMAGGYWLIERLS